MTAQPLPELQALLDEAADAPAFAPELSLPELRAQCDAGVLRFHRHVRDHGPLHAVRDLAVGGVPVRLYLPSAADALPVHVHVHGGGWWMGSLETVDPMARELAHVSGMAVVSVGYRLAPENPYPAGLDDLVAVLTALTPEALGFRPTTVSVGGESGGANLAAAACLRLRDTGGPSLAAAWLDVPCVDASCPPDASLQAYGSGYGLEMAQVSVLQAWYGGNLTDPYVSPALAELSGLPPTLVTTAECDPLRDQGARYAAALEAAGNDATYRCNPGQIHASSWFTALTPANAQWYDETVALLVARHEAVLAR